MDQLKYLFILLMASLMLAGCGQTTSTAEPITAPTSQPEMQAGTTEPIHGHEAETNRPAEEQGTIAQTGVEMPHIHGMGYAPDGRLFVAAHDGLRSFGEEGWSIPDVPAHDYMGYTVVDNGFYSSGHPHPSAGLINPLGLIKSSDGGQTLSQLGFEGESDFHLMGVGYQNHAIYVFNPAPNSRLAVGVYYSLDDGQSWQQSALQGLTANPIQVAVHPSEANQIAIASEGGLLLSDDHGDTLTLLGDRSPVTAATFASQGDRLLFGTQALFAYNLAGEAVASLPGPAIAADDAIAYIAINPKQAAEIALATFQRHIYQSVDGGQSWLQIAQAGKGISKQ
jgi:hypothetical protein